MCASGGGIGSGWIEVLSYFGIYGVPKVDEFQARPAPASASDKLLSLQLSALEMKPNRRCNGPWCHIMRSTESGEEVVQRLFI